jgi:hypothetical protein
MKTLPEPGEATINVIRQMAQHSPSKSGSGGVGGIIRSLFGMKPSAPKSQAGQKSDFNVGLSSIESPSSRLVLDLFTAEHFNLPGAKANVSTTVPEPDPRKPRAKVRYRLWRYNGTDPEPAIDPPKPKIAELVAGIAATPYNIDKWMKQAQSAAEKAGVSGLPSLLGVMVHPPQRPGNIPIWTWVQRVQVASACIIASLKEDWANSFRREALRSLALGPLDWTTGAAIIAMTYLALKDKQIKAELIEIITILLKTRPNQGGVCYEDTLATCGLLLPNLPQQLRLKLEQMARR